MPATVETNVAQEAQQQPKRFYDERYRAGYMQGFDYDVYEACRVETIRKVLRDLKSSGFSPSSILDYGCGEGRYIAELKTHFDTAELTGCDISDVGIVIATDHYPWASFLRMKDEAIDARDESFDLVLSIEVLEHVQDVEKSVSEIGRVLRPGGMLLITTPCANRFSAEWFRMAAIGGLEPSADGYGRFRSDEPGHLRRLNDSHMRDLFGRSGIRLTKIYHRSHLFTAFAASQRLSKLLPHRIRKWLGMLDWHLFKHLPNGATLLAIGEKLAL